MTKKLLLILSIALSTGLSGFTQNRSKTIAKSAAPVVASSANPTNFLQHPPVGRSRRWENTGLTGHQSDH